MNYLCILLRSQFTLWYRFGYINLHISQMIPFKGRLTAEVKENICKEFLNMPFEYDEEYLIFDIITPIEFTKGNVYLQQIKEIYPLTEKAKLSISHKIDPRIKLSIPFFSNEEIESLEQTIDRKERENAISMLWSLCNIKEDYKPYLEKLGIKNLDNAIKHRFEGKKTNEIHQGNYIDYLYTYDRIAYYQPTKFGYFQDAVAILTHYSFQQDTKNKDRQLPEQVIEGTLIFQSLLTIPDEHRNSFKDIFEFIDKQDKYVKNSKINGLDFHIITPIFLMLKNEMLRNNNELSKTLLMNEIKLKQLSKYKENFYYSLILFAYFFGYKYIYDEYYLKLKLDIFSSKVKGNIIDSEIRDITYKEMEKDGEETNVKETNVKKIQVKEDPNKREDTILLIISDYMGKKHSRISWTEITKRLKNEGFKSPFAEDDIEKLKKHYPEVSLGKIGRKKCLFLSIEEFQRELPLEGDKS